MPDMTHPETPIRILLGGGIGSGKSIAGRRFQELGAVVVEADRLGHEVLEHSGEAFGAVSERWPSVVANQRIDRGALAEIVFADPDQLTELEALTHPPIIRQIGALATSAGPLVVEIPLILNVPGSWIRVFVDADEDIRLRRAVERGSSDVDVGRRMANQPSREQWVAWTDETIDNNGAAVDLKEQIDALWHRLRTTDNGLRAKP